MKTALIFLILVFSYARGQYAQYHNYVGYPDTGGENQEDPAQHPDVETIVIPYNRLTSGEQGYVHGFTMTTGVENQPFKIQIWRRNQGSWQSDGSWQNSYLTQTAAELNGYYTVVYSTDVMYSTGRVQHHYLQTAVQVQEDDFLGFSYRDNSPFLYNVASGCTNEYTYTRMTSTTVQGSTPPYPEVRRWYTFDDTRPSTACRTYAIGMLIEFADITTDVCERLNVLETGVSYTLTSHDQYSTQNYDNNLDVCWVIHSYDQDHYLTFIVDMLDLEYFHDCDYDIVTFYQKSGDTFLENGQYCDEGQLENNEIFQESSIVKVRFATDYSRTSAGFQMRYKAVDTDYDPSSGNSNPQSDANTNNDDNCDDNDAEWKWKCLSDAEKILLICVIILLVICVVLFISCVIWYCCCRAREKVEPEKYVEDEMVLPHKVNNTHAIPYDYGVYITQTPYTPVYANADREERVDEQRTSHTYGQPKSLRPISEPLGHEGHRGKPKYEYRPPTTESADQRY